MSTKIYNNVCELVKENGTSIAQLEKRAGIANGTIGKWRDSTPKISSLESVAQVLKVSVNRLLKE